jgi:outer membrane protein insertion porin family
MTICPTPMVAQGFQRPPRLIATIVTLFLAIWSLAASAGDPGGLTITAARKTPHAPDRIAEIRVEGIQRIEPETVRSYLLIQPGDAWDKQKIEQSLKALFATGLFADVVLSRDGKALVVRVVENPIIDRIAFTGNSVIGERDLVRELQLRPRVVYTPTRVQNDVARLLDLYRRYGRLDATIEPKLTRLPENRVALVFDIKEGAFIGVGSINFVGLRRYGANELRAVIRTKENRWYRTPRTYDADGLAYDRDLLRNFYLTAGYADFRVASAVAELTPERDNFIITFTVDEGERYRFGKIATGIKFKDLSANAVLPLLAVHSGDWYNAAQVEQSITKVTDVLHDRGYTFVEVTPEVTRDPAGHTVDIIFNVGEAPPVYVERIDIIGNVRTLDKVIRRDFRLVEGDAFTDSRKVQSERALKKLGLFRKVEMSASQGSAPNRSVVTVEVEERSTGEFSVGPRFEVGKGLSLNASIDEKNFLGRGQAVTASTEFSAEGTKTELSFADPYVADRNVHAKWGFEFTTGSAYDWTTLVAGFKLTMWAGVLVFRIPMALLILLQGAYYTSLWSHDQGRCRRQFQRTMKVFKATVLLQITYVAIAHVIRLVNTGILNSIDV